MKSYAGDCNRRTKKRGAPITPHQGTAKNPCKNAKRGTSTKPVLPFQRHSYTLKLAVSDENVCRKVRKTYIIFKSSLYYFHFHGSISVPCLYHGITYRNLEEMSNPFYQKIDFSTACCRTIPIVQPIFGAEDDKTENPSALSVFTLN